MFSFPFPTPKVGKLIFHSHSQSHNLVIIFFISISNPKYWENAGPFPIHDPKCEKVIPAHVCSTDILKSIDLNPHHQEVRQRGPWRGKKGHGCLYRRPWHSGVIKRNYQAILKGALYNRSGEEEKNSVYLSVYLYERDQPISRRVLSLFVKKNPIVKKKFWHPINLLPKNHVDHSFQNCYDTWCQNCMVWSSGGCLCPETA